MKLGGKEVPISPKLKDKQMKIQEELVEMI